MLTAERDKYGANDVKPGLTGWAQINGRDELEIPDKARLDRAYRLLDIEIYSKKFPVHYMRIFRKGVCSFSFRMMRKIYNILR